MTPDPIPVRSASMLECRSCGAGAPVDEHFCPQCSRILALGRHGDYFSFFGLPRRIGLDPQDLERRFRDLSRKFHPDYFYNAPPAERLASLERSSYLNDAYRTLRSPVARIEHLLAVEGLPPATSDEGGAKVPPALLEEVVEPHRLMRFESSGSPVAPRPRSGRGSRRHARLSRANAMSTGGGFRNWASGGTVRPPCRLPSAWRRSRRCASSCSKASTSITCSPRSIVRRRALAICDL